MNESVYLVLSILDISKIVMYKLWYINLEPECGEEAKLFYIDADNFTVYIKTKDIYSDIAKDFEARFDTSKYELKR